MYTYMCDVCLKKTPGQKNGLQPKGWGKAWVETETVYKESRLLCDECTKKQLNFLGIKK